MADLSFEEFFNRLVAIENRVGAIEAKFDGVQLYPLLRVRIFYSIATQLGIFDDPHPSKASTQQSIKPLNGFNGLVRSENVVLPFKRTVAGSDPYSDRILTLLNHDARVLPFEGDDDANPSVQRIRAYAAEKFMDSTKAIIKNYKTIDKNTKRWHRIIEAFENEFGVSLESVKKYPPNALRLAFNEGRAFEEYFRSVGAKHLYIVNAYSETAIVLGAKRAGVKVHEIQHGFITALHPAYSYPKRFGMRRRVQNAPDEILTWGKFWTEGVTLPAGTGVQVTGPTESFKKFRDAARAQNRIKPKQVLFTSQGAVGSALLKAAIETASQLSDHRVIYRLHPNESLEDYKDLAKSMAAKLPKNFEFSHRDPIFLELVSESEYLVGAFSTTLYEGLALGCKVLVLPLPGFEHVRHAIDLGDMTLVDSLETLPSQLAKAQPARDTTRYYA
ncbi:MAG: hypothetical protein RLZZ400_55 [Actinomycetota bacterium]